MIDHNDIVDRLNLCHTLGFGDKPQCDESIYTDAAREIAHLRAELAATELAHATIVKECLTLVCEAEAVRRQLAEARAGLLWIESNYMHCDSGRRATQTLAKMAFPPGRLITETRQKQDEIVGRVKKEPDYER